MHGAVFGAKLAFAVESWGVLEGLSEQRLLEAEPARKFWEVNENKSWKVQNEKKNHLNLLKSVPPSTPPSTPSRVHLSPLLNLQVVCPLSVLSSWMNEIRRWCPELRAVRLHGPPTERKRCFQHELRQGQFDVCVTSYEMAKSEIGTFCRTLVFDYLVIDGAFVCFCSFA